MTRLAAAYIGAYPNLATEWSVMELRMRLRLSPAEDGGLPPLESVGGIGLPAPGRRDPAAACLAPNPEATAPVVNENGNGYHSPNGC